MDPPGEPYRFDPTQPAGGAEARDASAVMVVHRSVLE